MAQELFQHGNVTGPVNHCITNWRFVDTAARLDPSNMFTFRDIDKVCYDAETENYYILQSIDSLGVPTWLPMSTPTTAGEANVLADVGTGTSLVGPKTGITLGVRTLQGANNQIDVAQLIDGGLQFSISVNFGLPFSKISGKPTTLAGYGITDAAPLVHTHADVTSLASGFMSSAMLAKLDGIATGATANATNAELRDRATHTGSMPAAAITGLDPIIAAVLDSRVYAGVGITVTYEPGYPGIVIAADIADADNSNSGLMSASDYAKLASLNYGNSTTFGDSCDFVSLLNSGIWKIATNIDGVATLLSGASIDFSHVGVMIPTMGASANSGVLCLTETDNMPAAPGMQTALLASLDGVITNAVSQFGWRDTASHTAPSNGIYFNIAGNGNISANCVVGGVASSVAFTPVTPADWYTYSILVDVEEATFRITSAGVLVEEVVISTNVPNTVPVGMYHGIVSYSATGTAADPLINVDYIDLRTAQLARG